MKPKTQPYYMMRLYEEEKVGCTRCGETTEGHNTDVVYVWVVVKDKPDLPKKDEVDLYCVPCWEKEE